MANTLRFKRGLVSGIPTAALGEPLFTTDTFDLYIGNGTGNTRFQKYIASGTTSQLLRGDGSLLTMPIVLTSPSNGEVLKYNGTNWVNSADAGVTGSGTAGQVTYWGSSSTITGSNNLFWDATNNRLGVGLNNPSTDLHISKAGSRTLRITNSTNSTDVELGIATALGYVGTSTANAFTILTSNTERARIFANGNIAINSTTDNGLRFQVTGDGYFSGSVGIGITSLTGRSLAISKTITGATTSYGILNDGVIQPDVTSIAGYNRVVMSKAAGAATSIVVGYWAVQGTYSGTVDTQYGYLVDSTLTGATNNYAFFSNIASGTGRWNLYMNGTAANYLAGSLGIGVTAPVRTLHVNGGTGVRVSGYGVRNSVQSSNSGFIQVGGSDNLYGMLDFNAYDSSTIFEVSNTNANNNAELRLGGGFVSFRTGATPTERMRLDASGNLGLGVGPSAWSGFNAMQLSIVGLRGNVNTAGLSYNTYYDGTNFRYINTGGATDYYQNGGRHVWNYAASGTAGSIITFTQAMTLDTSGNLGLGTASPTSYSGFTTLSINNATNGAVLDLLTNNVRIGSIYTGLLGASVNLYATANVPLIFGTNNTEIARFFANGNFRVGAVAADAGFRLDVNGTMRVSGALTVASTGYTQAVFNGTNTSDWGNHIGFQAQGTVFGYVGSVGSLLGNTTKDMTIWSTAGNGFRVYTNGNNLRLQIDSAGAATFSSSVTGASFIPSGSTVPTNGMYLPAANTVAFSTNSTEDMRLTSGGNLLINTTTDSGERLQVSGTAKIGTHSTTGFSLVVQNNGANDSSGIRVSTGATVDGYISMAYDATNTYGSIQAGDNNVFRNIIINRQGGSVGIGANPNNSAVLQADSTTRGFLPPRMTTTQRNAIPTPAAGLIVYDTTDNKHYGYNGSTWNAFY